MGGGGGVEGRGGGGGRPERRRPSWPVVERQQRPRIELLRVTGQEAPKHKNKRFVEFKSVNPAK